MRAMFLFAGGTGPSVRTHNKVHFSPARASTAKPWKPLRVEHSIEPGGVLAAFMCSVANRQDGGVGGLLMVITETGRSRIQIV